MDKEKPTKRIVATVDAHANVKEGDILRWWRPADAGGDVVFNIVSVSGPEAMFVPGDLVVDPSGKLYEVKSSNTTKTFATNVVGGGGLDAPTTNFKLAFRDGISYL